MWGSGEPSGRRLQQTATQEKTRYEQYLDEVERAQGAQAVTVRTDLLRSDDSRLFEFRLLRLNEQATVTSAVNAQGVICISCRINTRNT